MRRKVSANDPQCGGNAEEVTAGCNFDDATISNNGIPSDLSPEDAARWAEALRWADHETLKQMSRERAAKATKPDDLSGALDEADESVKPRGRSGSHQ